MSACTCGSGYETDLCAQPPRISTGRYCIVDETGQVVRGPVSKARAQQLLAILRPAFPTYRLVREAEAPR